MAKCDMHLHSRYSKEYLIKKDKSKEPHFFYEKIIHFVKKIFRDNNSGDWSLYFVSGLSPIKLYERAMKKGMDFFCLTDHDTFDGCSYLLKNHPKVRNRFITGVEITSKVPEKELELHVNIYNLNEHHFKEIKKISGNLKKVVDYCRKHRLICSINHLGTGKMQKMITKQKPGSQMEDADLEKLWKIFRFVEVRNGVTDKEENEKVETKARRLKKCMLAGSDSHAGRAGRTWTEVPGVKTKEEFLEGIRKGISKPGGGSSSIKVIKDEITTQARTYSGVYYSDRNSKEDEKLGNFYDHEHIKKFLYFFLEKTVKAMVLASSGIMARAIHKRTEEKTS